MSQLSGRFKTLFAALLAVGMLLFAAQPAQAASAQPPVWDDLASSYTVPAVAGVQYLVDGVPVEPGSHQVTDIPQGGKELTVSAQSTTGEALSGTTTWKHLFPQVFEPQEPQFQGDLRIRVKTVWGTKATYQVDGQSFPLQANSWNDLSTHKGQQIVVTLTANDERKVLIKGQNQWTYNLPGDADSPTWNLPESSFTIPAANDFEYLQDGQLLAAGTHQVTDIPDGGKPVSITAHRISNPSDQHTWTQRFPKIVREIHFEFNDVSTRMRYQGVPGVQVYVAGYNNDQPIPASSWIDMSQFAGQVITITAQVGDPSRTLLVGQDQWQHEFPGRPVYSIANGDEFNGTALARAWKVSDGSRKNAGLLLADNVSVHDGVLDVRTRRHCVKDDKEPLTDENHHPGVCPAGTITKYGTGRISSGFIFDAPGTVEIRAKLDDKHHGVSASAWLHNDEPFCGPTVPRSDLAEFDVMEMWRSDEAYVTTHLTCENGRYPRMQVRKKKNFSDGQFHTWKVVFDGEKANYFIDGELLTGDRGSDITGYGAGISQQKFVSIIVDHKWQAVLGVAVAHKHSWAPSIDDAKPYPDQHTLFDYIRYTPLDKNALNGSQIKDLAVIGAIGTKYWETGGLTGPLGNPLANESCWAGRCRQDFEGGSITWSPDAGGHVLLGAIRTYYDALGGIGGPLGLPTSDEICRADGCYQEFQNGRIYWSPETGSRWVHGAILARYLAIGGSDSFLGYPISDEICGHRDGGCVQLFQRGNGHIFWSPASGAWETGGAIHTVYSSQGWEWGRLGYPLSPEICYPIHGFTECTQIYQGGRVLWNPVRGGWRA